MPAAPNLKNTLINVINHRETNVAVTSIFIIISLYITFCAILQKDLGNPLAEDFSPLLNVSNDSYLHPLEVIQPKVGTTVTVMALFLLWVIAMVFGQIIGWIYLPPLLGMLLAGIMVRNVDIFAQFFNIDAYWDDTLRNLAFLLILIRCGINLEPDALKRSLGVFTSLGFLSTTVEALAVVLVSHFMFDVSVALAILFAFVLTSTSPAVSGPSMIRLQEQGRGTNKGIPTTIMAAVSIDNIYCITAFSIVSSVVFTRNEDLTYLIVRIPIEVLIGMLFGILFGLLLRVLPRDDVHHVHFIRCAIISSFSTAIFFATRSIGCEMVGPIAVFMMVVVTSMRWKIDNHRMTRKEERCFKIVWDDFLQPFLFALIGLLFDFSVMNWDMFWNAMSILFIGAVVRIITVFIMSLFMFLSIKEKIFVSLCFLPKATVQAALAPLMIRYAYANHDPEKMNFLFNTCVLSILITAPIGQLIIDLLGKYLLDKEVNLSKRNFEPIKLPNLPEPNGDFKREPSFIQADKDNRLRLQVTPEKSPPFNTSTPKHHSTITTTIAKIMTPPTTPKAKPRAVEPTPPPPPTMPPPSFDDIHSQAFEIFKEQRLKQERRLGGRVETITEVQTSRPGYIDNNIAKF
uniref:Na_H_Exchanger domain-containing protein n=1 Tax=Bursaphelenchus xylophilus TaxID=6326 RepID=A0A1I7S9J9_BURXY